MRPNRLLLLRIKVGTVHVMIFDVFSTWARRKNLEQCKERLALSPDSPERMERARYNWLGAALRRLAARRSASTDKQPGQNERLH